MSCLTARVPTRIQSLDPGEYQVTAVAVGYKSEPRSNVKVDAYETISLDFSLQKGMVRWADLSILATKRAVELT